MSKETTLKFDFNRIRCPLLPARWNKQVKVGQKVIVGCSVEDLYKSFQCGNSIGTFVKFNDHINKFANCRVFYDVKLGKLNPAGFELVYCLTDDEYTALNAIKNSSTSRNTIGTNWAAEKFDINKVRGLEDDINADGLCHCEHIVLVVAANDIDELKKKVENPTIFDICQVEHFDETSDEPFGCQLNGHHCDPIEWRKYVYPIKMPQGYWKEICDAVSTCNSEEHERQTMIYSMDYLIYNEMNRLRMMERINAKQKNGYMALYSKRSLEKEKEIYKKYN